MAHQISLSSISFYKTEFDLLYQTYIANFDPQKIAQTIHRMVELQDHMLKAIQHAFANPPRRILKDSGSSVDAETIKHEIQGKLQSMIAHNSAVAVRAPSAPAAPKPADPVRRSISDPTDLAVGFGNMSANCWINSLLAMLPSLPSFRTAFETVGKHYAASDNAEDKKHGQYLLNALTEYDAALVRKQPLPPHVSQNVRLAFHYLFGTISASHLIHEDAFEAMVFLMGRYEKIVRTLRQPMPSLYSPLTTSRHYRPLGSPSPADPEKVRTDQYSELTKDNVSASTQEDYQILLDLQNKGHLSFSELVTEYFCNTHPHSGHGTYLLPDKKQVQQFELIGERRRFARTPQEFLLTIKRFGANMDGSFKIGMPLSVSKTLVLPETAEVYELDVFNVHSGGIAGGHYSTYRMEQGRWIEINDAHVRFVSEEEIAEILEGRKGPEYTSYMHHYVRKPGAVPAAPAPSAIPVPQQEIEANTELSALPAPLLETLRLAVWMHDGAPDVYNYGSAALAAHPERVREIRRPWLIAGSDSLWDQLRRIQTLKLQIATEKNHAAKLRAFLAQIQSSAANDVLLASLRNLPQTLQNTLHGLIYQSHLTKFGREKVDQSEYGRKALEQGDVRKTLIEATESVFNLWGNNILEQLIADTKLKIKKLEIRFEKDQLQGFYELLIQSPTDVNNRALVKAFERLEIRDEIKEKLYWHIWNGHGRPSAADYGRSTFRANPRVLLSIKEPNLARSPLCPQGANILWQMITLLDHESR